MKLAGIRQFVTILKRTFVLSAFACVAIPCGAEFETAPSVSSLSNVADNILVGTGTFVVSDGGKQDLVIHVLRVIKGHDTSAATEITVDLGLARPGCDVQGGPTSITAVWFLQASRDGSFYFPESPKEQACRPMTNYYEVPKSAPTGEWEYKTDSSVADRLALELAASYTSSAGLSPIAVILNQEIFDGDSRSTELLIDRKLAESSVDSIRARGFLGLIRFGDPGTLATLASDPKHLQGVKRPEIAKVASNQVIIRSLRKNGEGDFDEDLATNLRSVVTLDRAAAGSLGTIALSTLATDRTRIAAAHALRNAHTAQAISLLAPLLYDKNVEVRTEAILGISYFANAVPVFDPSRPGGGIDLNQPGEFKGDETMKHLSLGPIPIAQNEQFYLTFWRSWWATNGSAVQSSI